MPLNGVTLIITLLITNLLSPLPRQVNPYPKPQTVCSAPSYIRWRVALQRWMSWDWQLKGFHEGTVKVIGHKGTRRHNKGFIREPKVRGALRFHQGTVVTAPQGFYARTIVGAVHGQKFAMLYQCSEQLKFAVTWGTGVLE